jgi:hypothetical protein
VTQLLYDAGGSDGSFDDIVLVAGRDPYAWKGTEEIATAHVRPSGEGGCGSPERNVSSDAAAGMAAGAVSMSMAGDDDDDDH